MPRLVMMLLLIGSPAVIGCFAGGEPAGTGIDDDYMDDPPPPGDCPGTGTGTGCSSPGTGGSPLGGPCLSTSDCALDAVCVADFDGEVQSFTCQSACVPLMDDSQWCADSTSCCDGATCSPRGFCLAPGQTGGLDTGGSSGIGSTDTGDPQSTGTSTTDASTGSSGSTGGSSSTG